MKRRQTLQLIAAATVTGLAGCQFGSDGTTPTETSTVPPDCPESRYSDVDTARFDTEVICYRPEVSGGETPALVAETSSPSLPDATVTFSFTNPRESPYVTNFYEWGLFKHLDDRWHRVVSTVVPVSAGTILDANSTHTWTFTVENTDLSEPIDAVESGGGETTIRGLGGGTYAFLVSGTYDDVEHPIAADTIVSYATQFTIEGPPVELVPTETVVDVQREGERVDVTLSENPIRAWTVSRTTAPPSDAETQTRYITEQLYGQPLARNALAHFGDGVEQVVVRTGASSFIPEGYVTYDGVPYRVESEFITDR